MAASKKRKPRGISTGYDPKTGKVGYTRSVKPKAPEHANYATPWAKKTARNRTPAQRFVGK